MRTQGMPAREDAQVLQDDGLKEGSHQLVRRRTCLLQTIDICFRKYTTLAGHFVQLDAVICLVGQLGSRDLQLGVDLVDDRARTAGTLVIHRGNLLLSSSLFIVFEDDDLCILATQLDDRIHLGMELFDGERDRVHFLNKLGADHLGDGAAS